MTFCQRNLSQIELVNISVVNGPILKDYYWKALNFKRLNQILVQLVRGAEENAYLKIPPMPINSPPIQIVLHFLNQEPRRIFWSMKRTQLCSCGIVEKPVGINNFRNVYNCPHRELLTILPTTGEVKGGSTFTFTLNITYVTLGENTLGYEFNLNSMYLLLISVNDDYKLHLRFKFDVFEFDPRKCILTDTLLPACIFNSEQAIQPIWIHNPLNHDLEFKIQPLDRNLRILNENISISSGSTNPLLVQFKPNRLGKYELVCSLDFMGIITKFKVQATATNMFIPVPVQHAPKVDFASPESPFTIYKNYLPISIGTRGMISKMVMLHNTSDSCIQFLWKPLKLKEYYTVDVTPVSGTCNRKQSVSCVIKVTAGSVQSVFGNILVVCEIYKFTGTKIDAVEECSFHSSLDEPKDTTAFITRLFVNLCLRVHALRSLDIPSYPLEPTTDTIESTKKKFKSGRFDRDVFDKLFWNFIYNEDFLNDIIRKKVDKRYAETIRESGYDTPASATRINKAAFLEVLQTLTTQAVTELQRNWRFIPKELGNPII